MHDTLKKITFGNDWKIVNNENSIADENIMTEILPQAKIGVGEKSPPANVNKSDPNLNPITTKSTIIIPTLVDSVLENGNQDFFNNNGKIIFTRRVVPNDDKSKTFYEVADQTGKKIADTIVNDMQNFGQYMEPGLSSDGKKIVFVIHRNIYIRDLENPDPDSNTKKIFSYESNKDYLIMSNPSINSTCDKVVFVGEKSRNYQIYEIDINKKPGDNLKQITNYPENERSVRLINPNYSPDGKYIVFQKSTEETLESYLVLYDINKQNLKEVLIKTFGAKGSYAISPDGSKIAFLGFDSLLPLKDSHQILLADLNENLDNRSTILKSQDQINCLNWSQDGEFIFYIQKNYVHEKRAMLYNFKLVSAKA